MVLILYLGDNKILKLNFIVHRLITIYYEIRYRILKAWWSLCSRWSTIDGIVLMFHHISDKRVDELDSCQHTIEEFKNSIITLTNMGYEFVSIDTAINLIKNKSDKKFALITFDDVPINAYINAVPILEQMKIPYAFFITTGYIGTTGFLSSEQLKLLDNNSLCTIGAHTVSHTNLRFTGNIYRELYESKQFLETLLGHTINYLAYPYGRPSSVSYRVRRIAKKVGFTCAFGTIDSQINDISACCLYYLPRVVIK